MSEVSSLQKLAIQVAKEVVLKFIETGRISPNSFEDDFSKIYKIIEDTIAHVK